MSEPDQICNADYCPFIMHDVRTCITSLSAIPNKQAGSNLKPEPGANPTPAPINHRNERHSEELCWISPFGVFAPVPFQPIRGVIPHPVLGPLIDVDTVGSLFDVVVRIVDPCQTYLREAVLDDRRDVLDVEG